MKKVKPSEQKNNGGKVFQMLIVKDKDKIEGKYILLVDDVITTGATLEACGRQLLKNGAAGISIATLAIAK